MSPLPNPRRVTGRDLFSIGMVVISFVMLTMISMAVWLQNVSRSGTDAAVESVLTTRTESAASWVADYVEATETTTHGLKLWFEAAPRTVDQVREQLLVIAAIDDQLTSTGIGFADGSWLGIRRAAPDQEGVWLVSLADAGGSRSLEVYDAEFTLLSRWEGEPAGASDEAPFWRAASTSEDLEWVTTQATPGMIEAGVWAAEAVRGQDGSVAAVVATEFPVDAMTEVLEAVVLGDQGGVFLLDGERRVIASPLGVEDIAMVSVGPTPAPTFSTVTGRTLESLGISTTESAEPYSAEIAVGYDGDLHTAELGLAELGVPWVLHLRALDAQVASAIFDLQVAIRWASGILLAALLAASGLFFFFWRPTRDLHKRANTDLLTGLLRRGRFLQLAPAVLAESRRVGHSSCAVVLDLDNFKSLNDELGHETGDVALERVGTSLRSATRSGDLVSRWGGDEFVALLELIDPTDALFAVERLREKVEAQLREEFPDHPELGVTAGGAVSCGEECDIETLIRQADEALVEGKRTRKSRTYMAVV